MTTTDQTKTLAHALADCDPALVAAAPDLLAALEFCMASGQVTHGRAEIARAAIAKAKNQA